MRIKFSTIIILLIVFMAIQEPLINKLPLPGSISLALRGFVEVFLFGAFVLFILRKIITAGSLRLAALDWAAIFFVITAVAATILNDNRLFHATDNIRVLLRFLTIYYLTVNIVIEDQQAQKIIAALAIIGVIEGALSLAQYFFPSVNNFFILRSGISASGLTIVKSYAAIKVGAAVGTFGAPAEMAFFQCAALAAAAVFASKTSLRSLFSIPALIALALIAWGAFATYKRFALLMMPIVLLIVLIVRAAKPQRLILITAALLALIFAAIFFATLPSLESILPQTFTKLDVREEAFAVSEFVSELFSPQYWRRVFNNSRGWFMITATQHMLQSDHVWIGYGPDHDLARAKMAEETAALEILDEGYSGFEDVYWVTMLIYYGVIGAGLFLIMLGLVFKSGFDLYRRGTSPIDRSIGLIAICLAALIFLDNFAERAFELRSVTFLFWLFAGMTAGRLRILRADPPRPTREPA
jgi:hypothetical protein